MLGPFLRLVAACLPALAFVLAAICTPAFAEDASSSFDAARPPGMGEADWAGLKAAIGVTGPYTQLGELAPTGLGRGPNHFGYSVAVSGDRAVVGAPSDYDTEGRAYVLEREASTGRWIQVAVLRNSFPERDDRFGWSVAISADTIAVGAHWEDVGTNTDQGQVDVFVRTSDGSWERQAELTMGTYGDWFGYSVALQGDTLAVGSPSAGAGMVFVYTRSGASWLHQASLWPAWVAPDEDDGQFGYSLALDSDGLLVGMRWDDTVARDRGSAWLFKRSGTTWNQEQGFYPEGVAGRDFGASVALAGRVAVVGAPGDNDGKGVVHTFVDHPSYGWGRGMLLMAPNGASDQRFGAAVALSGAELAVGAPAYDAGSADTNNGAVFVYTATSLGQWAAQATFTTPRTAPGNNLGSSVALLGDTLLAGVPYSDRDFENRGHVEAFRRSGAAWSAQPIYALDESTESKLGSAVALSGSTAVVSAPGQPSPFSASELGVAHVYVRGSGPGEWRWQATLPQPEGGAVAIDAETVLVGVPKMDLGGSPDVGAVFVFVRTDGDWALQATLIDSGGHAYSRFGQSVALVGNTAVIGAPGLSNGGGAFVFTRSGTNWTLQQRLTAPAGATGDSFGLATAVAGNTIVVGAPTGKRGDSCHGRAYVFGRSGSAWSPLAALYIPETSGNCDYFGYSVAVSGSTILVGAPYRDGDLFDRGAVYAYTGSGMSWTQQAVLQPAPGEAKVSGWFGIAVALAGQTAVVGASGQEQVDIFTRQGAAWSRRASAKDTDAADWTGLGQSVALSGTLVLAGAPEVGGWNDSGRAYLFGDDRLFANGFENE